MGQRPADSGHIKRRRGVFQDRKVTLVEDVPQVVVVRLSLRVRLVEALVTRTPGELCQQVSVGADPVISNSGGVLPRSEEHTSELQSRPHLVCRLLLEKK